MSDVVFVYLGQSLPRYVDSSLKLATKFSGQRVVLIANSKHAKRVKATGVEFAPLEDFYDPTVFAEVKDKIVLGHNFRKHFWLYTLERLFVLEQYMAYSDAASLFHAELDQLLFGTNELVQKLNITTKAGLFFPFHSREKAVASVLFVNEKAALEKLFCFAADGEPFMNEMELLVRFSKAFPEDCVEPPTIGMALPHPRNQDFVFSQEFIAPADLGPGVVDAAELGLWVGGRDPRNLGWMERPRTKWVYGDDQVSLGSKNLEELRFHFEPDSGILTIHHNQAPENIVRLYNLHIHSKIHSWIWKHDSSLKRLFGSANSPNSLHILASQKLHLLHRMQRVLQKPFRWLRSLRSGLRR